MTVIQILVLAILAAAIGRLTRGRSLAMLGVSTLAVFWLQPSEPFVSFIFWLPVATLTAAVFSWALTSTPEARSWRQNWPAAALLVVIPLAVDLNRYLKIEPFFVTSTPVIQVVIAAALGIFLLAFVLLRWQAVRGLFQWVVVAGIILVFIFIKSPHLLRMGLGYLADIRGADLADRSIPFAWLGYSYVAFRLIHTIRDRQSGRLPPVLLADYLNYVIFFPSFTAGPIDRLERFLNDLKTPLPLRNEDWLYAGTRLILGLFKKFVIANLLAVISLSDGILHQVTSAGWMWLFLYAYSFRIFFDFSGYTDVAIGMGRLMGIQLPENFAAPYLKPNLTQFWNSWHITLTQWFRAYFFNPLTRFLRTMKIPLPVWSIILITQISTMVLIGLWHGITMGFVCWGLWHGAGLFIQNRWSEFVRNRLPAWAQTPPGQTVLRIAGVILTFNFVTLGWLFFDLSTPAAAWFAMKKLFGLG